MSRRGRQVLLVLLSALAALTVLAALPTVGGANVADAHPDHPMPPPGIAAGWHRNHDGDPAPDPGPGSGPGPPAPGPGLGQGPPSSPSPDPLGTPSNDITATPLAPGVDAAPEGAGPAGPSAFAPATPSSLVARALETSGAPRPVDGAPPILLLPPSTPPATSTPPPSPPFPALPPAALVDAVAVGLTMAAVGGTVSLVRGGHIRRWLFWIFTPLYTRLARSDVLAHEARASLYDTIEGEPGVHFSALKSESGLRNGVLLHHLRVLEKNGYVRSATDGRLRRYFVAGAVAGFRGAPALDEQVYRFVSTHPAATNAQIAVALQKRPTLVHYHVDRLARSGQVTRERVGREVRLYATS